VAADDLPPVVCRRDEGPLIGLNVSGWLHSGLAHVPLTVDYRELIRAIVQWAMSLPKSRLLLVPHVFGPECPATASDGKIGFDASDLEACQLVHQEWKGRFGERIGHVNRPMGAGQLKYIIGQCHFFIGARMHACIGAASMCVPTAVLAYSLKAEGVFGLIGTGSMVVEMRRGTVAELAGRVRELYERREALREDLRRLVPQAKQAIHRFFGQCLPKACTSAWPAQAPIANDVAPGDEA
jgi:hypothetical protein